MDIPHLTTPPTIHVREHNSGHDRQFSASHSHNAAASMPSAREGMAIPNRTLDIAPPPLPPPKFIKDLDVGNDTGWKWGNSELERDVGRPALAPIKQGSSLFGGYHSGSIGQNTRSNWRDNRYDNITNGQRERAVSTIRSPSEPEIKVEELRSSAPGIGRTSSRDEANNHRLHGERLAQQCLDYSSNAYDKHLLSKIGKPNSPPRQSSLGSIPESALPRNDKDIIRSDATKVKSFSLTDAPSDPASRWVTSPSSTAVSPGPRTGYRDYVGYRSPSVDSNAPYSAIDAEYYSRLRDDRRGSITGSLPGTDDSVSLPSRSNRGSYDQSFSGEPETDFPMEETSALRQLNIDDRTPPRGDRSSLINRGRKRRASSPPREPSRDEKLPAQNNHYAHEYYHRPSASQYFPRSPNSRFHPNHGSVSSTASSVGPRNGSYASSAGLSVGGSSMTSMSSYGRHSPRAVSPTSDLDPSQDCPYISSASLNQSPSTSLAGTRTTHHPALPESKGAFPSRKMSGQIPPSLPSRSGAQRMGNLLICECCPKKPKKFETAEELRTHQMEKQYTCQFCNNRFKNKNEAERHQNSLHLRRHSWSCAAIAGPEAAFHPSTAAAAQTHNGPSSDTCGYCGEEFPNFPQRDWERRFDHLTNIHKFAECNQSKKFFRADHFRQHLKHSHAGTSGKWTNMLENACMREELPTDMPSSIIPGSGTPGPGSTSTGYGSGVMGNTIDERHDES